ncbi:MAG: HAMP domain-containing protein [Acidobacteria bacterium]|nr:HAMP domain-containing protein [Acidobacteriota bacterium]
MLDSVRTRLTLWHTGALAFVLIAFSVGVYLLAANQLHRRLDAGVRTTVEGISRLLAYELAEGEREAQAIHSALTEHYFPDQAAAIFDVQGRLLEEKVSPDNLRADLPAKLTLPDGDEIRLLNVPGRINGAEEKLRVAARHVTIARENKSYLIVVSQRLSGVSQDLAGLRGIFLAAVPIALLLAGFGGWLLARKSLAPVSEMSQSARRISAERLGQRLPIANPRDELGQLAATFNELLARLQESFAQQRQFVADASHELRTPLHVIHTATEVMMERPQRDMSEYRETMAIINEQTRRLNRIVEDLFTLARADAGQRDLEPQDFYLDELLAETARAAAVLAARKQIAVEFREAAEAPFRGDEALLRQMLLNLLDNAVKHTPAGGEVALRLVRADSTYSVVVTDTGTGVPIEAQPHIFERFYRADKARSRAANGYGGAGAGLGLSIALWVAEVHGGSLILQHSDHTGSAFRVTLPTNQTG